MKAFWITDEKEKPLDTLVKDGGFCGIFRRIGCVGDPLLPENMRLSMRMEQKVIMISMSIPGDSLFLIPREARSTIFQGAE